MDAFSKVGMGAFFLVSFVLGIRLLCLAARTRKLPELIIGSSSLCSSLGTS